MGICASVASSDIHETNEIFEEEEQQNAILIEAKAFPDKGLASVYSEQGTKGLNQDTAILCQGFGLAEGSFCGVFDGHGKNGHIASKLVRNRLPMLLLDQQKALASTKPNNRIVNEESLNVGLDKWRRACVDAFKVMDKELKLQNSDLSSSGTTAVTIIKQDQDLVIANLGDSRAILGTTSDSGELVAVQLTTDLKPGLAEEEERIKNNNGRVYALKEEPHIQRVWLPDEEFPGLAMSRAFGDFQLKNHGIIAIPEISYRRVDEKDKFVVLATDGVSLALSNAMKVWDVLSNDDVASTVWTSNGEDTAAKAVVDAAVAAWKRRFPSSKRDDCTVACLFLHEKQPLIT